MVSPRDGAGAGEAAEGRLTETQAQALFRKCGATSESWAIERRAFDRAVAADEQRRGRQLGMESLEC